VTDRASRATTEDGASSVEYGLLIAGIAAVIVAVVLVFGGMVDDVLFDGSCDTINQQLNGTTC